ncbi:hypothetical protein ACFY12_35425 [Streptomyces sp. NPDC001339]|uniref:hypothetical protein n=1 Tax=Streptomyces sp. NPDC001339 TaxID=3364563 RepID=UPI00369030F8
MRLRRTVAAAFGALTLALTLPAASADAATGRFTYVFKGPDGPEVGMLIDPPSYECLTLPEAELTSVPPAHSPRNATNSGVRAFKGPYCTGDYFDLRPHNGYGSKLLKVRSVLFYDHP